MNVCRETLQKKKTKTWGSGEYNFAPGECKVEEDYAVGGNIT
jgi:hypothetical protein